MNSHSLKPNDFGVELDLCLQINPAVRQHVSGLYICVHLDIKVMYFFRPFIGLWQFPFKVYDFLYDGRLQQRASFEYDIISLRNRAKINF